MRRAPAWTLVAACALIGVGCATVPPCPARGGPAWTQWESAHFVVLTDLAADDAREVVRGFEDMRQAVLLAAWRRAPEPKGRLGVVVFRDDSELRAFLPSSMIGAFITVGGPIRQSFIVKGGAERDDVVTHELVHALALSYGLLDKVEWLDEGLARYLEGMRLQKDGTVAYGEVHANLFRSVTLGRLTSFENLWHAPRPEEQAAFSATSWITVHYLFNHEAARFGEFQRRLIDGAPPLTAWKSAFPDLDARALDARLAEYVFREGEFASFVARLPPTPHDAIATPLGDAEVHALRALMFATTGADGATQKVRAEVTEALRIDPLEPRALYLQRTWLHEATADVEGPKKLIARHPDDTIAWALLMLARLARHEPQEATEALEELTRIQGAPGATMNLDLRLARPD